MSENPFKIIRSTDQPPEHLRNEVMGSVRMAVLLMRFAQLFLADYAQVLFDKLSIMDKGESNSPGTPKKPLDS